MHLICLLGHRLKIAKLLLTRGVNLDIKGKFIVTHSVSYSLSYSPTHSLNHSPTHSLTHLLTHSLTYVPDERNKTAVMLAKKLRRKPVLLLINQQANWDRKKGLMMVLAENYYFPLPKREPRTRRKYIPLPPQGTVLTHEKVLCDINLVRKIMSYM